MLNASKFLRTLAASALVAGTLATLVPALPAFALLGDADTVVAAPATSVSPNTPGAVAGFTIGATTTANLGAGISQIIVQVTVPSNQYLTSGGWTLPATISKSSIALSGTTCDQAANTVTACTGGTSQSVTQTLQVDPTVDTTKGTITFYVPDMNPSGQGATGHNLALGGITIAISALAGITNPTSSSGSNYAVAIWDSSTSGANITASMLNAGGPGGAYPPTSKPIAIPRVLQFSGIAGARGGSVTVNGFGFTGPTVNLFLDNGIGTGALPCLAPVAGCTGNDGIQSNTEPTLASNVAVSGGKFSTSVVVGPNFTNPGFNFIQALDRGGPQTAATRAISLNYDLQPSVLSLTPTSNSVGSLETIQLQDEPGAYVCGTGAAGGVGTSVNNSGVAVQGVKIACTALGTTISNAGAGQLIGDTTIVVVSTQPFGTAEFVTVGAEVEKITGVTDATHLAVLRAQAGTTAVAHADGVAVTPHDVMISAPTIAANGTATWTFNVPTGVGSGPATVSVHGMNVGATLSSEGASTTLTIQSATITVTPSTVVPNQQVTISGTGFTGNTAIVSLAPAYNGVNIAGPVANAPVTTTDSGGNMVMQFKLNGVGSPTAAGSYTVNVTDASGTNTTGLATITVPNSTLVISPNTGLGGSTITFSGAGMAANTTVTINFPANGVGNNTTSSVQSDASGNYSGTLTIPSSSNLTIPSTVTVTATTGAPYSETASALFNVPAASLTVTPATGAPGTSITVSGTSFPVFTSVAALTIGGNGVALTGVNTDANGSFSTSILIPGLTAGTATVVATVGTTTANTSITVTTTPTFVPATTALAALVNTQNLNIVTSFNYSTQLYQAYVPALAGNSLVNITPNSVIFVTMTKDTTIVVSGISFNVKANIPTPLPVGAAVSVAVQ